VNERQSRRLPKILRGGGILLLLEFRCDGRQSDVNRSLGHVLLDADGVELDAVGDHCRKSALGLWQGLDQEELANVLAVDDEVEATFAARGAKPHSFFPTSTVGQFLVKDAAVSGNSEHECADSAKVDELERHLSATRRPICSPSGCGEVDRGGEGHVVALDAELSLQDRRQSADGGFAVLAKCDKHHFFSGKEAFHPDPAGLVSTVGVCRWNQ